MLADEFINRLRGKGVEIKGDGPEYRICCPFCTDRNESQDTRFRFGFNLDAGLAGCYNCGWGTRSREYLIKQLNYKFKFGAIEITGSKKKSKKKEIVHPEDFIRLWPRPKGYWGRKAYRYIRSRGVTRDQIIEHNIGYTTTGFYRHRIVIPTTYKGKIYGYQGRTFVKSKLKYKNSTGIKVIFGLPDEPSSTVVLLEGKYDALAVERAIEKLDIDAGAVLGHTLTEKQLKQLRGYKYIILWLDPDKAGVEGLESISKGLKEAKSKARLFVVVPRKADSDPSDLDERTIRRRIRRAKLLTDGIIQKLKNRYIEV